MRLGGSSSAQGQVAPKFRKRTGLPLVPCPTCGEEIMELTCGPKSKVPGAIFFKCRLHERDVPRTCPWYLFADKYEKMLIANGTIEKDGTVVVDIRPDKSLHEVEEIRLALGHNEGLAELAPLLDDVVSLNNGTVRVDEKLQKLISIGKIAAGCLVVVTVFVVVGVITMLVK